MRVFIYWNLHRACWSIKALSGPQRGRVIAHAKSFEVFDATFKVSEAGRQRVLREQRKNVHAGVVGQLGSYEGAFEWGLMMCHAQASGPAVYSPELNEGVTYNPYKGPTFVSRADGRPVHSALRVVANGRDVQAFGAT